MSLKGACDKLESAFADAESKLDRVNEKVDQTIAQANYSGQAGKFFSSFPIILFLSSHSYISDGKPSHLLQNLKDIKAEHSNIAKELKDLKETQDQFVSDILTDLKKLEEAKQQLLTKVGSVNNLPSKK